MTLSIILLRMPEQVSFLYSFIMNDKYLHLYLPTVVLVLSSEILFNTKNVLTTVNRPLFLTAFRIKHLICLLLVPRLWLGDASVLL